MEKSPNPPPYVAPEEHYPPPPQQFPPLPQQYPPPPQQYPQTAQPYPTQPQTTVIVGGTQLGAGYVVTGQQYGPASQAAYCPHCQSQILTRLEVVTATKTHLYALLLCLFACWPCACIPYCIDSCKNKNHHCPECGAYLGTYNQ